MTRCGAVRPCATQWHVFCSPVTCIFSKALRSADFPSVLIMTQTLPGPRRISHSFSARCRLAHVSPILSERFVPVALARGPVSTLFLVRASQVQDVEMCAHRSTTVFKGWAPGGLGASDGGQNLCRCSLCTKCRQRGCGVRLNREAKCVLWKDCAGAGTERGRGYWPYVHSCCTLN